MYNERELLLHHKQLLASGLAAADLQLLKSKKPNHPRLAEFALNPKRYADDILMELLRETSRDDIVKNRMQQTAPAPTPESEPSTLNPPPSTEEPEPEPEPSTLNPPPSTEEPVDAEKKTGTAEAEGGGVPEDSMDGTEQS